MALIPRPVPKQAEWRSRVFDLHPFADKRPGAGGPGNAFLTRLTRSGVVSDAEAAPLGKLVDRGYRVNAAFDLLRDRQAVPHLHVLLEGWACRYRLLADGRRQITMVLLPGDICDLDRLQVLNPGYAVATLTACTLATLDCAALRVLVRHHQGTAWIMEWLAAAERSLQTEHIVCLGRRSARERFAYLLCELFTRLAVTGRAQADQCGLPMTQEELSDVLGISPVHVNRVLKCLRDEGMIALNERRLTIRNWAALSAAGEFRPEALRPVGIGHAARETDSMEP